LPRFGFHRGSVRFEFLLSSWCRFRFSCRSCFPLDVFAVAGSLQSIHRSSSRSIFEFCSIFILSPFGFDLLPLDQRVLLVFLLPCGSAGFGSHQEPPVLFCSFPGFRCHQSGSSRERSIHEFGLRSHSIHDFLFLLRFLFRVQASTGIFIFIERSQVSFNL
jgi:hypothetical protein